MNNTMDTEKENQPSKSEALLVKQNGASNNDDFELLNLGTQMQQMHWTIDRLNEKNDGK